MASAFTSAGQRCSAARVLFVQDDIADKVITMLAGAMAELKVGDPGQLSTDVGPVIDADALGMLDRHAERMPGEARLIAQAAVGEDAAHGPFFAPPAWELKSLSQLDRENFGPALPVTPWNARERDPVSDARSEELPAGKECVGTCCTLVTGVQTCALPIGPPTSAR